MKTLEKIIREMRESVGTSVWTRRLADELEAAMSEPVAEVYGIFLDPASEEPDYTEIQLTPGMRPLPAGTKLYAFPPDAAGEIERLREALDVADRQMEAAHRVMDRNDAKIERLREALDWYAEQAKTMQKATLHVDNKVALHVMKTLALDGGKRAADVAGEK